VDFATFCAETVEWERVRGRLQRLQLAAGNMIYGNDVNVNDDGQLDPGAGGDGLLCESCCYYVNSPMLGLCS
jgi:hypothetical protein